MDESLCSNPEVYFSVQAVVMKNSMISGIAFVFPDQYIEEQKFDLAGIENAFIISYHQPDNTHDELEELVP
jgi:hypothetical protein